MLASACSGRDEWAEFRALLERALDPHDPLPPFPRTGPADEGLDVACLHLLVWACIKCYDRGGITKAGYAYRGRQSEMLASEPVNARMARLDAEHAIHPDDPTIQALRAEETLSVVDPVGAGVAS